MKSEIKFGTDGWRAVMCDTFTFANVRITIQAIADYLANHGMTGMGALVGYDSRFLSERFAREAAEVLAANGVRTLVTARDTPTPTVAFTVSKRKLAGAVMFTASHNPPEYNGVKWIPYYAGPADPEITSEIERNVASAVQNKSEPRRTPYEEACSAGLIEEIDPAPDYISRLRGLVDLPAIKAAGVRVVYDAMYATGRGYVDRILKDAGCDVEVIHGRRDPLFGGGGPDPVEARLGELRQCVLETGADLGIATDGDADRFGVIDSDGTYISANQVISLLLVHLIKNRRRWGKVVRTIATTHLIDRIARANGLDALETPVGFKYICQAMRESDVVIGGEESGGLSIGGHIPEKDGILANLLLAEFRAMSGKTLGEALRETMEEYGPSHTRRIDIHLPNDARKGQIMQAFEGSPPAEFAGVRVQSVSTLDGVKVVLSNGDWFLIRPSGTEPVVRVYGESGTVQGLERLLSDVQNLIG
ncbi:MAG: phosphoglucomutase/phosphomannomutase family protein [Firmicutes bacterium]|nr:phosphoglucomutase/phosphomannomutase family protein [Bacillota bacterium]